MEGEEQPGTNDTDHVAFTCRLETWEVTKESELAAQRL